MFIVRIKKGRSFNFETVQEAHHFCQTSTVGCYCDKSILTETGIIIAQYIGQEQANTQHDGEYRNNTMRHRSIWN